MFVLSIHMTLRPARPGPYDADMQQIARDLKSCKCFSRVIFGIDEYFSHHANVLAPPNVVEQVIVFLHVMLDLVLYDFDVVRHHRL